MTRPARLSSRHTATRCGGRSACTTESRRSKGGLVRNLRRQAHLDEYRGLSGLLIIPSSHLAEQMSRGRTLAITTRAGARTFSIPTDAVKAFEQCASALTKRK
jgi:hypothetical protein